jgi:hypothetical protein
MLFSENPESGWPDAKKFIFATTVTIGLVKIKTINKSMRVVRPRVKANPRTPPTAKK